MTSPCPELHFAVDLLLLSFSVGGRLSLFLDSWRSIKRDQYVLHLLQQGHHLSFESQPLLTTSPVLFPLPEASGKREHLRCRDPFHVEQVVTRVLQPVVRNPQKEWQASLGHRPAIIKSPLKEGEVSNGNTRKSAPLHSEGRLGDLVRFDGRISARSNSPIVQEVSSFLLPGRSISVLGPTLRVVGEPKSVLPCGGCDDGPCSISGFTGPPLSRRLAPEEPAAGPPQDSNPGPSSLDYSSRLDTQPGEVRVIPNSRLCLYRHTLSNQSGADVPSSGPVQRSSQSCSSDSPGKVCYGSTSCWGAHCGNQYGQLPRQLDTSSSWS